MSIIDKVVWVAESQLGVQESPAGSNKVKYNTWYYGWVASAYWCCIFVCWVFFQAGLAALIKKTAGCTTLMNWFKANGQLVPVKSVRRGDLAFFQFDKDSYADHIGIVVEVTKDGVVTIEGNTSLTSDDNGGAVMRRTRKWNQIMAVGRPAYENVKEDPEMTEEQTKNLVKAAVAEAIKPLDNALTKAIQELTPTRYKTLEECPSWAHDTVKKLVDKGALKGTDSDRGLDLTDDILRPMVIQDRMGLYGA